MSISPRSGAEAPETAMFEIYSVLKWESRLTLGINAAKFIDYILKNVLNKSCSELNFQQISQRVHMSTSTGVQPGAPKIVMFEIL